MKTIRFDVNHMPERNEGLTLALGNFDGMHRGHQKLFVEASLYASKDAGVLFFATPYGNGPSLSSLEDKCRYALNSRLDVLYLFDNDPSFFGYSPVEFITKILIPLGVTQIVVGEDFRFGKDRKGDPSFLKQYFKVHVIPLLEEEGKKISSSSIKGLLLEGKVDKARDLLGRSYEISGTVGEGFHNGGKIGYPTANLALSHPYVLPRPGVYCGIAYVSGKAYRAMVNVGTNPTLGLLKEPIVEAHLLEFDEDCYGKVIYVAFLSFLREERRFDSLEELKAQLQEDEAKIKELIS